MNMLNALIRFTDNGWFEQVNRRGTESDSEVASEISGSTVIICSRTESGPFAPTGHGQTLHSAYSVEVLEEVDHDCESQILGRLPYSADCQSNPQRPVTRAMHIHSIPMCECCAPAMFSPVAGFKLRRKNTGKGTGNNYAYLVVDEQSKNAAVIDPANPPEYARCLRRRVRGSLTGP